MDYGSTVLATLRDYPSAYTDRIPVQGRQENRLIPADKLVGVPIPHDKLTSFVAN